MVWELPLRVIRRHAMFWTSTVLFGMCNMLAVCRHLKLELLFVAKETYSLGIKLILKQKVKKNASYFLSLYLIEDIIQWKNWINWKMLKQCIINIIIEIFYVFITFGNKIKNFEIFQYFSYKTSFLTFFKHSFIMNFYQINSIVD